jgi:NitT/TauT family transport system substrate-binding protein
VDWTVSNPSEAGNLVQSHTLGLQAPIASKVIPNGAYVFIPAHEARPQLEELFSIFLDFAPEAIGGTLPGDSFYFE